MSASARDLRVASLARDEEPALACFHAQQGAAKALKGAAVIAIVDVEQSHSLVRLLHELTAAQVTIAVEILRACQILERYYAPTRYPDAIGGLDPGDVFSAEDARETYALALNVVAFARTPLPA